MVSIVEEFRGNSEIPKIYVFHASSKKDLLYHFKAIAQDGSYLAEHDSTSVESGEAEMTTSERRELYEKYYPNGYELVGRGLTDVAAMLAPATEAHLMEEGRLAFFQAQGDNEFRRALAAGARHLAKAR